MMGDPRLCQVTHTVRGWHPLLAPMAMHHPLGRPEIALGETELCHGAVPCPGSIPTRFLGRIQALPLAPVGSTSLSTLVSFPWLSTQPVSPQQGCCTGGSSVGFSANSKLERRDSKFIYTIILCLNLSHTLVSLLAQMPPL